MPAAAPGAPAAPPPKKSKAPWILGALVALLALVGGAIAATQLLGGNDVQGGVTACRIEADGTLAAQGWVSSGSSIDGTFDVRFDDVSTGTEVDRDRITVKGPADRRIPWTAKGKAGDKVQKVTCVLGPPN